MITAADIGDEFPVIPLRLAPIAGLEKYLQPVIAHGKVRYAGEPVAVIVADSRALAEDALEHIEFDIDALDPVADRHASETDRTVLFEQNGTNVATHYTVELATPTRHSSRRICPPRDFSGPTVIRRRRWKPAQLSPNGTRRPPDRQCGDQGDVFQSPHARPHARSCRKARSI